MKYLGIVFLAVGCMMSQSYADHKTDYLIELPPGFMPFEEFEKEFQLGDTSTEKLNAITKTLSQKVHKNIPEGLGLLLDVDENVVKGFEDFIPFIDSLAPTIAEKIGKGGRVFLVGSGSSGRVAIDIAAKCNLAFPGTKTQIQGLIAGGDSAMIRAKEGFEDSDADGMKVLKEFNLGFNDTVILISASGSASFNVGCGHFAANQGVNVLYFYNSVSIPERTQQLFKRVNNPATPLCVDIASQAIAGSTRLQGATIAEAGLGAFLVSALYLNQGNHDLAKQYARDLATKMREGLLAIRQNINNLANFVTIEKEVFLNPNANFRHVKDHSDQGYITLIAAEDSMREVLIDSTETSPTFSTNPIRRESEIHNKRAEFRAYLVEKEENLEAWQALLGRKVYLDDEKDTEAFLLSCKATGNNSYQNRPVGKGNFLIGVAKLKEGQKLSEEILHSLEVAKKQGGKVGLLLICRGKFQFDSSINNITDAICVMENVPYDSIGFVETIILKQSLNLISNGSMILLNKVHGNQMIDVRASNKKLIDRCIRLIKEIWSESNRELILSDKEIYYYVAHVSTIKKAYEKKGMYTPSVVKIVLAMIALKKTPENFQEIVDILAAKQERIDWIGE